METREIIDRFTHAEALPIAALQAASARRDEVVPEFLREIEAYLALGLVERARPTPLFFVFHLLGQWRKEPHTDLWPDCCTVRRTKWT